MILSLSLLFSLSLQATRSEKNVLRDSQGHLHLGKTKSVKKLFAKNGNGAERYAKSE